MGLYGMSYPLYTMLWSFPPPVFGAFWYRKNNPGDYQEATDFRIALTILRDGPFSALLCYLGQESWSNGVCGIPGLLCSTGHCAGDFLFRSCPLSGFSGMQTMVPQHFLMVERLVRAVTALFWHVYFSVGNEYLRRSAFGAGTGALRFDIAELLLPPG